MITDVPETHNNNMAAARNLCLVFGNMAITNRCT